MIQIIKIEEAIGCPLAYDITEIRSGGFKGPAFKRGHILETNDLAHLRSLGKDHLYILKPEDDEMHEDDAARRIANALCGRGVRWSDSPQEGRISIRASIDGLFKVDVEALNCFNMLGDVMCATRYTNTLVRKSEKVASTRAIPLIVSRRVVEQAEIVASNSQESVLKVLPLKKVSAGVMITGNEVFYGRIEDKFEPVIRHKVRELGGEVLDFIFLPDDDNLIGQAALDLVGRGADVLITTGGMSVDPDDRTRFALKKVGALDMVYGSSVLPGAMFMIAYLNNIPVLSIPSCGIFAAKTVFDLIYPRVLTGEKITRKEIALLGHGGLCLR